MNISSTAIESVTVVRLDGNLDTNTSPKVQESLNKLINEGASKVLVNFAEVDFASSAGLRVLLATAKRLGGSGEGLRICNLNETVAEIFEISGFSIILRIFATEEEALRGF